MKKSKDSRYISNSEKATLMTGYLNWPVVLLNLDYCIDGATIVDELVAERAMVKR
jgi:hypothetical protein